MVKIRDNDEKSRFFLSVIISSILIVLLTVGKLIRIGDFGSLDIFDSKSPLSQGSWFGIVVYVIVEICVSTIIFYYVIFPICDWLKSKKS